MHRAFSTRALTTVLCFHFMYRYIGHSEGGDANAGRFLSGLSLIKGTFSQLPVHFHPRHANMSQGQWAGLVPHFDMLPLVFRESVVPYLGAIAVYHITNGDVARMFPANHPYLLSAFYTQRERWTISP